MMNTKFSASMYVDVSSDRNSEVTCHIYDNADGSEKLFEQNVESIMYYYYDDINIFSGKTKRDEEILSNLYKSQNRKYQTFEIDWGPENIAIYGVIKNGDEPDKKLLSCPDLVNHSESTGMAAYIRSRALNFHKFVNYEIDAYNDISDGFDEFFPDD